MYTIQYLVSAICSNGSLSKEIITWFKMTSSAWQDWILYIQKQVSFLVKLKLYKSLTVSMIEYRYEIWDLTAVKERGFQVF